MIKTLLFPGLPFVARLLQAEGGAAGAAADPPAPDATAAAAAAANTGTSAKWWEAADYSPEEKTMLAARGWTDDNPLKVLPKMTKSFRAAEQRIGKGLDSIIDKPGKDQPLPEWMRANAAALGLPDKEDGYAVEPPDFWPKEAVWDKELEASARKLAFETGTSPAAHKAYVDLFAHKMKGMDEAAKMGAAKASAEMMTDLRRDFGEQTPTIITGARQAAEFFAEKANLPADAIEALGQSLSDKIGDANTIRFLHVIRQAMGEDQAVALGQGGSLTMTPADARAELQTMQSPGGAYYEATKARNLPEIDRLKAKVGQLTKIAAGK